MHLNKGQRNTIYLVRHGENPANINHEFSYKKVDYSLTPRGILQAEQTGDYFKTRRIDEIYASPLKRAKETAEFIARPLHMPVTIMEQFREINVGDLEGRPPTEENWRLHDRIVEDWFEGKHDTTFPGGEDYHTLLQRLRDGLRFITAQKTGKHIVVVGHGGIFTRPIRDICPAVNVQELLRNPNYNCSITEIEPTTNGAHV
ncbi:MAG: hypothetical protein PVSMB5_38430 [Ktedonobacteraceae bacterium]